MSEQPEHPDPAPSEHRSPADQRKGAFISGGTFHKEVIGYQEITQLPPPPPPMPLAEVLPLLASLPASPDDPIPVPQTLPDPHRMILSPNPLFVGREHDLRTLAARLKAGESIAVTTGIGGVGKTQLAVELAHRYGRYFGGGVFWLSCADPAGIPAEVAACGRAMGLYRDAEQLTQDEQVARVRAAWASELPRLLIFDNCEEEAILRAWKPTSGASRVLVTSRRATWSATLGVIMQPLDVLLLGESVALLRKHCPALDEADAVAIAEELGRLPLALHLAGHFLARYPAITPAAYLAKLRIPALLEHPSLVGHGVQDMPTEREPHVARAFALSFERLDASDEIDALALALLARAACLAPGESFPRVLLAATVKVEGDEEARELALTDALERLVGLGLLEQEEAERLRLHRLLAAYSQYMLPDEEGLRAVARVVNEEAYRANGTGIPQTMQSVLAHLRHLLRQEQAILFDDELAASLCSNLAYYLWIVGSYHQAQRMYEQALALTERVVGPHHLDTARSLSNLGGLYRAQGAYEQALPLYERALTIRKHLLGSNHVDTAASLSNLAGLYRAQGNYKRAQPLYEQALAITERVQGSNHLDTARSLNNLAWLYEAQGAYKQAQPLYERALVIAERVLGQNHPDIARTLNNLAGLYRAQGAYKQALLLYERALAISDRILGSEHPFTATCLNNLAALYEANGNYERAQLLYERSLAIDERVLGVHHPDTARTLDNLARLYRLHGASEQALPLLERALTLREKIFGLKHPETAITLNNLAGLYQAQGAYERAQPLYERALAIREQVLGATHPDTASSLNNLASLYETQGGYERALPLYERALAIRKRVLGVEHPDTASSLNNLAVFHANRGQFAFALPLLERAIQIWQVRLGSQHPNTVQAQESLAALHQRLAITALPEIMRAALQTKDGAAFEQALRALPPEEAQAVVTQLQAVGILGDPLAQFMPLLQAIAAVGQCNDGPRTQVEADLAVLEQHGFHLTVAVRAIWTGQRDPVALTAGLDDTDTALIRRVLTLLDEAPAA